MDSINYNVENFILIFDLTLFRHTIPRPGRSRPINNFNVKKINNKKRNIIMTIYVYVLRISYRRKINF